MYRTMMADDSFKPKSKASAAIFSEPSSLAYSLAKLLLEKSCDVLIVSSDVEKWLAKSLFDKNSGVSFVKTLKDISSKSFDYVVCLDYIKSATNLSERTSAKTIFVFPYTQTKKSNDKIVSQTKKILKNKNLLAGILFVGNIVPKEEFFEKGNWLFAVFDSASRVKKFIVSDNTLNNKQGLYLLTSDVAAKEITRSLFSLKAYGKTSAVTARPFGVQKLYRIISGLNSKTSLVYEKTEARLVLAKANEEKVIDENVIAHIEKLAKLYFERKKKIIIPKLFFDKRRKRITQESLAKSKIEFDRKLGRPFKKVDKTFSLLGVFVALLFLIFIPQVMIFGSYASAVVAKTALEKGSLSIAKKALESSSSTASFASDYSSLLSRTPIVGDYYKKLNRTSKIFYKSSSVSKRTLELYDELFYFWTKIFDDEDYNSHDYADKIYLELDYLYKELGFLQGEMDDLPQAYKWTVQTIVGDNSIAELRSNIYLTSSIARQVPELLGAEKPKTYLVILQNNLLTRPTGGVIESFALLTFSQGKLLDSKVYDVSFADSKLKGYVDPPEGLENVPGWHLRDANWDPDFPTSAVKMEWFLDKSVDISVDGVISMDIEFIKEILKEKGPITLADDEKVNHNDLYKRVYASSKREDYPLSNDDFFANLLTQFLSSLIETKSTKDNTSNYKLAKLTLLLLSGKNAQAYLHNTKAQSAVSELGWDGAIKLDSCEGNCYSDMVSVMMADISRDKAPHSIRKSAKLVVSLEEGLVKKRLKIFFESEDDPSGGNKEKAELYVRVLADKDAGFGFVEVDEQTGKRDVAPKVQGVRGYKEAGIKLELLPGESKFLSFSWEGGIKFDFEKSGEYRLTWIKQAGASDMPVEIEYNLDSAREFSAEPAASLTDEEAVVYNSEKYTQYNALSRDFTSSIYW